MKETFMKRNSRLHLTGRNTQASRGKTQRRLAAQVAITLCNGLRVQEGTQLVGLIGDPDARNNREAVETWTREQIPLDTTEDAGTWSSILASKLEHKLTAIACD